MDVETESGNGVSRVDGTGVSRDLDGSDAAVGELGTVALGS